MNCLHSFKWKIKLQSHEKDYRNHDFLMLPFMPDEKYKILKYTKYTKFLESMPFIIYADLESLAVKISKLKNNSKKSSTTKEGKHTT